MFTTGLEGLLEKLAAMTGRSVASLRRIAGSPLSPAAEAALHKMPQAPTPTPGAMRDALYGGGGAQAPTAPQTQLAGVLSKVPFGNPELGAPAGVRWGRGPLDTGRMMVEGSPNRAAGWKAVWNQLQRETTARQLAVPRRQREALLAQLQATGRISGSLTRPRTSPGFLDAPRAAASSVARTGGTAGTVNLKAPAPMSAAAQMNARFKDMPGRQSIPEA